MADQDDLLIEEALTAASQPATSEQAVDPDEALLQEAIASGPAVAPGGKVYAYSPTGELGTMAPEEIGQAKGFRPATQSEVDHALALEGHKGLGSQIGAGAEALARGATFGASDAVQSWGAGLGTAIGNRLADQSIDDTTAGAHDFFDEAARDLSGREIQLRKEAGGARNTVLEVAGAVLPGMLSGGAGTAGSLARLTPAGQLANLSTKLGIMLTERAATGIGRIGALVATGAFEGAVDNTTRTVMQDLAQGNTDITAERMLEAAWDGAKWGGAVGGGLGALAEGVGAAGRGIAKAADKFEIPSVADFASGRAFKAAMGKTSIKGVRQAERFGGPEAVGRTLLDEGIVTASDTLETIAEKAAARRAELGKALGDAVKQADELSGGKGLSRSALKAKLYEDVIDPLKKSPVNRDVAEKLEAQFASLFDELSPSPVSVRGKDGTTRALSRDSLTFEQADAWRKELDQRLNWEKIAPDVATEAKRDMRRAMSDFWLDAADKAADASGKAGFGDEIRALKKKYSHIALADDLAQDGIKSKLSNRFVSPSDYGVGAAGALLTGGPGGLVAGAAGAMANRFARERGNQIVAATLYSLARGAVKQENAVKSAVSTAMKALENPKLMTKAAARLAPKAVPAAAPSLSVDAMVAQAQALQDPNSEESQKLEAMVLQMAPESPEFADAIKAKVMQKATFIVSTLGPSTDPGDPLGRQPMPVDPITKGRNSRFMRAVQDPAGALDRLASGQGSAEDLAIVRELTPQLYKRWSDAVIEGIKTSRRPMGLGDKQKWHRILGQPIERSQTPAYVQFYQNALAPQQPQGPQAPQAPAPSSAPGFKPGEFSVDNGAISRSDDVMTPGDA